MLSQIALFGNWTWNFKVVLEDLPVNGNHDW